MPEQTFKLNDDNTAICPSCRRKVRLSITFYGTKRTVVWFCPQCLLSSYYEADATDFPLKPTVVVKHNIKWAILELVKEKLASEDTMSRWILGGWLVKLGTLVEDYQNWSKIVDAALDMTW